MAAKGGDAIAVDVIEAADRLSIGKTYARGLVRSGELRSFKLGRRILIPVSAIEEFVAERAAAAEAERTAAR